MNLLTESLGQISWPCVRCRCGASVCLHSSAIWDLRLMLMPPQARCAPSLHAATHIGCLLLQLPVSSTIYTMTAAEHALADGPLWNVLQAMFKRSVKKAGTTSLSKTLARKRPALLPILDDIAANEFDWQVVQSDGNWAFLRNEIAASALVRPALRQSESMSLYQTTTKTSTHRHRGVDASVRSRAALRRQGNVRAAVVVRASVARIQSARLI